MVRSGKENTSTVLHTHLKSGNRVIQTVEPIAEKKNWAAATSNNPDLLSRNDDRTVRHRSKILCWGACVRFGCNRGDTSFGMGGPSPLAGKSESDETRVTELETRRAEAMTEGWESL